MFHWMFTPCIMCVQYRGGCSVPWGDILSTVGVFSTMGDIMINVGDSLSTVGVFSTVGDIMSTVGVILSTVGDIQYRGGYHDACGGYHEYRGGKSQIGQYQKDGYLQISDFLQSKSSYSTTDKNRKVEFTKVGEKTP